MGNRRHRNLTDVLTDAVHALGAPMVDMQNVAGGGEVNIGQAYGFVLGGRQHVFSISLTLEDDADEDDDDAEQQELFEAEPMGNA